MTGITVTLYEPTRTGTDALNNPVIEYHAVSVDNVLVGEPTSDEVSSSTQAYGKLCRWMLGIPKGDRHNWTDAKVTWTMCGQIIEAQTFGPPIMGIEELVPGPWHMKVRCQQYGG